VTGWPPGLLQDDCRALSIWFATRIDARWVLRQVLKEKLMTEEINKRHLAAAKGIARCADRLVHLLELKAPAIVLEQERQLIQQYWMKLPVDTESQQAYIDMRDELWRNEQEHLHKTSFYDEFKDMP
jgi:hypothetical protein